MANLKTVYIVRPEMSSPFKIEDRAEIDDMTVETKWHWTKDQRQAISKVRGRFRARVAKLTLPFHGLQIARKDDIDAIEKLIGEARGELQVIDPSLDANVAFIALAADQQAQGEVYQAMLNAIRGHVFKVLNERLVELAKLDNVPEQSRLALIRLCEAMKKWNVLDDPSVNETIENFRLQFENNVIKPVAVDMIERIKSLNSAGARVEL
jgi:hypothetical protein